MPYHASQMYARNIATFLKNMVKDGQLNIDLTDEITRETLVARDGERGAIRACRRCLGVRAHEQLNSK